MSAASMIGIARKARALTTGLESVLRAIRTHKALLVITAADASAGSLKTVRDKCSFYAVRCEGTALTKSELGHAAGRGETSVAAFTELTFVNGYLKACERESGTTR